MLVTLAIILRTLSDVSKRQDPLHVLLEYIAEVSMPVRLD